MGEMHYLAGSTGAIASEIANSVTRLYKEFTGRGPTSARAVMDGDLVTVLLREGLTTGERTLISDGKADLVEQLRREFHATMRDDLVEAVEVLTERSVIAFMGAHDLGADITAHSFVLASDAVPIAAVSA